MTSENNQETVILFSAPSVSDSYYKKLFDGLIDFYNRFIEERHENDFPLIIAEADTMPIVQEVIPTEYAIASYIPDIWIRDFAPIVTPKGLFKFRYLPDYLPQKHARDIDRCIKGFYRQLELPTQNLPLIFDGGNFVFNGKDKAVITERVLSDNSEYKIEDIFVIFTEVLGVDAIAIIPEEEGDVTGHADGMVKWLDENKLAISRYDDTSFTDSIVSEIENAFDSVEIVEMPFEPTGKTYQDFADATGIYVNALTTPNAIYIPVYDVEADREAIAIFENHCDREIIPIYMGEVALLGGSLNCLSWSISGEKAQQIIPW